MRARPLLLAVLLAVVVAVLVPLLASRSNDDGRALPAPDTAETTTTTEPVDLTQVSLEPIAVEGKPTSTTRPLGGGKATIFGRVLDGGTPVPGAVVRATYYGDPEKPEVIEVLSGEDGSYRFEKVLGGRWRIRAWRAPEMATLDDEVFFLGYTEQRQIDLKVKGANGIVVTSSLAPNPPFVGEPVEVAVLVLNQSVDEEGIVHRTPAAGAAVTLNTTGQWYLGSDPVQATDYTGRAAWTMVCTEVGEQPLSVFVGNRDWPLNVPACRDPLETTTTTTTTTVPSAESTTTTTKRKAAAATSSTRPKSYATTSTRPRSSSDR